MTNTTASKKQRTANLSEKPSPTRPSKRICLPIEQELYQQLVEDEAAYRSYLDTCIRQHPELFPKDIGGGYKLYGFTPPSKKLPDVRIHRICLHQRTEQGRLQVYQLVPCFVLPYRVGYSEDVEKALFLHYKFGVPFWALTYVFGRNDMLWYRLSQSLGRNNLVGTTLRPEGELPKDALADEKHTRIMGHKAYATCTIAQDCVFGAGLSLSSDKEGLEESYGDFKREAQALVPEYAPTTVNCDGWGATQAAWRSLFPKVTIILCFLHAFLKIRERSKRLKDSFCELAQGVWEAYRQESAEAFMEEVAALELWVQQRRDSLPSASYEAVMKLCGQAQRYALAYDHPTCYRTSNMLDRHLDALDRYLYSLRYFHGHLSSAHLALRSWALAHNFMPYCSRTRLKHDDKAQFISPAHRVNGSVYRENWLENLLVSASLGGERG